MSAFLSDLSELHITCGSEQISLFARFHSLLVEANKHMNLTAITEPAEIEKKHFIDSLSLVKYEGLGLDGRLRIIDIGSGAGFPGIPLKIAFPDLEITLLDATEKRVRFMEEAIGKLGLSGIQAIHGRAEELARDSIYREQHDLAISRAVASLGALAEYALPFVKVDGLFIAYKGKDSAQDLEKAENAITLLGGKHEKNISFLLPNSNIGRTLIGIRKVGETAPKYPRKAAAIKNKPL